MVGAAGHAGLPTTSINWSGYAATSKKAFNSVRATWIVPRIKCTGVANQWTSNWVGLDGFNDSTVEQDGTFAGCGGAAHTKPYYTGWIEMFPAPSKRQFWVQAGDTMTASVVFAKGRFTLRITDVTAHKGAVASATCSDCKRASAEWIIERPGLLQPQHNQVLHRRARQLRHHRNGGLQGIGRWRPRERAGRVGSSPIDMIQPLKRGFISLDQVSALSGPSFGAQWQRSGSPVPITLGPEQ